MASRCYEIVQWSANQEMLAARFSELIGKQASFKVLDVPFAKQGSVVRLLELTLNNAGKNCLIRTQNRAWFALAAFLGAEFCLAPLVAWLPHIILVAIALTVVGIPIFILLHRIGTLGANFEIVREFWGDNVYVNYKQ